MKPTGRHLLLAVVYGLTLAGLAYLLYSGASYYLTPLIERPRHQGYWSLKPGGSRGYWLGIVGTALMVVMHVYSVRRRARVLRDVGRLSSWLNFHIYCGLLGPALIVLHSSFKVQGLVALSFWSMIAVAGSGVLGRYLYLQIPRRRSGDELTMSEMAELNHEISDRLRNEFGLSDQDLKGLRKIATKDFNQRSGLASLLVRLPVQGVALRWKLRRFARGLKLPSGPLLREMLRQARQMALLERRIILWQRLQQLFHYWHVFHKPFAIVMYLFAAVHIGVVLVTGYGWMSGR
jgi:hypothetical protein